MTAMPMPLRVLIVEDREADAAILIRELRRGGYELVCRRVETATEMSQALAQHAWDLVLSDYSLPQFSALAAVRLVAEAGHDLPFIVISGLVGEEAAVEVMRAGAHDFLPKGKLARMLPVIERELAAAARRAEHREAQMRLRRMEKMEALGQLTGGIAHDFNNILAVIIGMTELAAATTRDAGVATMLRQIDDSAERGVQLVRRLLAFARKRPLETRVLDLNATVRNVASMLERTLGDHIVLECKPVADPWPVLIDSSQLEDAILNLALNARDAMPDGGTVTIETRKVCLDASTTFDNADAAPGDYVAVIVTDTGHGIPPEILERVFEPFFTTKPVGRGTGLGLSMVYGFVNQSGGHVQIRSEVGRGTSISLYFPRVRGSELPASAAASNPVNLRAAEAETILVVEDDAAVRNVATSVLQDLGYRTRQAADGRAALDMLRGPESFDLLFTDTVMPNGIGGHELIRLSREIRPGLKALLTSGHDPEVTAAHKAADGSVPMLSKPYRREALASAVRAALSAKPRG